MATPPPPKVLASHPATREEARGLRPSHCAGARPPRARSVRGARLCTSPVRERLPGLLPPSLLVLAGRIVGLNSPPKVLEALATYPSSLCTLPGSPAPWTKRRDFVSRRRRRGVRVPARAVRVLWRRAPAPAAVGVRGRRYRACVARAGPEHLRGALPGLPHPFSFREGCCCKCFLVPSSWHRGSLFTFMIIEDFSFSRDNYTKAHIYIYISLSQPP